MTLNLNDTAFVYTIGARGGLSRHNARTAARDILRISSIAGAIILHISGYDDDPRELWDIREVCRYASIFVRALGTKSADDLERLTKIAGNAWVESCAAVHEGRVLMRVDDHEGTTFRIAPRG
jgi:hypothetical protein